MFSLEGKVALVVGVADATSIAWGCARALKAQGAELAVTYLDAESEARVRPLAEALGVAMIAPMDVREEDQIDAVFDAVRARWGKLDVLLHSIAYCPERDLHARVTDCSRQGFAEAMDVSVHSFLRLARRAEPMTPPGGTYMTLSFFGAQRVVANYNVMGPVKAALEASVRALAVELGARGVSVHALSPGPLMTRAASGIAHFDELLSSMADRAPTHHLTSIDDVGAYAAFLASREAHNVTGCVHYVDGGFHIVG